MKNISLMILALVLIAGLMTGCAEKKSTEEAQEAPAHDVESVGEKPAEVKEAAVPVAGSAEVEDAASRIVESVVEEPAEVKEAVVAAVEKVVEKKDELLDAVAEKAPQMPAATGKSVAAGAAIFKTKCSPCHGSLGQGTPMAPAFKGNDWIKAAAKSDITSVIRNGRAGPAKRYKKFVINMPAQKGLPDNDINALADYIKSIN